MMSLFRAELSRATGIQETLSTVVKADRGTDRLCLLSVQVLVNV